MVFRSRIISRSRAQENGHFDAPVAPVDDDDDVWYQKDKLFKDHIQEVLNKWTQIDDEIWSKVIVLERNRRVAKAYARAPVLTINGSDDGFDGFRIGLCGFDNPMRDQKTDELRRHIGQGIKLKMDETGNIMIKRLSKSNIYIKSSETSLNDENAIASEIVKQNGMLEPDKAYKLFDMKKFQSNINRELKRAYPDRRRLENQCVSIIAFVKHEPNVLECPIWVLIINIVAMDMLKSKLAPIKPNIAERPRIPIPDEDPYAVGPFKFNNRKWEKPPGPPVLPPRDMFATSKNGYEDIRDVRNGSMLDLTSSRGLFSRGKEGKKEKKYDDPYYCGLSARVPTFVKATNRAEVEKRRPGPSLSPTMFSRQLNLGTFQPTWNGGHGAGFEYGTYFDTIRNRGMAGVPSSGAVFVGEWD